MKKHVLIVDDDSNTRFDLAIGLKMCGYRVSLAMTREEALDVMAYSADEGASVDMLIVDIQLADMQGEKLISDLNKRTPSVPVITVSGFSDKLYIIDLLNRMKLHLYGPS
jgi:DNA-binding NtrC family response regulator